MGVTSFGVSARLRELHGEYQIVEVPSFADYQISRGNFFLRYQLVEGTSWGVPDRLWEQHLGV